MEEDWEDVSSEVSEEWIDVDVLQQTSSTTTPRVNTEDDTVLITREMARRLREAETRANNAEDRAAVLHETLREVTARVMELEVVVQMQREENNRLLSTVQDNKRTHSLPHKARTSLPSKAHSNRAPQSVKLSKKNYWAKNNHRSSGVSSARKY